MPADLIERLREAGIAASDGHAFGRPDTEDVLWWIDKHADKVLRELLAARLEEMDDSALQTMFGSLADVGVIRRYALSMLAPEVPRG